MWGRAAFRVHIWAHQSRRKVKKPTWSFSAVLMQLEPLTSNKQFLNKSLLRFSRSWLVWNIAIHTKAHKPERWVLRSPRLEGSCKSIYLGRFMGRVQKRASDRLFVSSQDDASLDRPGHERVSSDLIWLRCHCVRWPWRREYRVGRNFPGGVGPPSSIRRQTPIITQRIKQPIQSQYCSFNPYSLRSRGGNICFLLVLWPVSSLYAQKY